MRPRGPIVQSGRRCGPLPGSQDHEAQGLVQVGARHLHNIGDEGSEAWVEVHLRPSGLTAATDTCTSFAAAAAILPSNLTSLLPQKSLTKQVSDTLIVDLVKRGHADNSGIPSDGIENLVQDTRQQPCARSCGLRHVHHQRLEALRRGARRTRRASARAASAARQAASAYEVLAQHGVSLPRTCVSVGQQARIVTIERMPRELGADSLEHGILAGVAAPAALANTAAVDDSINIEGPLLTAVFVDDHYPAVGRVDTHAVSLRGLPRKQWPDTDRGADIGSGRLLSLRSGACAALSSSVHRHLSIPWWRLRCNPRRPCARASRSPRGRRGGGRHVRRGLQQSHAKRQGCRKLLAI
mmetsp:Transcript_122680/g.392801  ORF Transcript_122680/g.392801 Transcript_122680/m.392801 type:complete len:354 (-) Transcript_122680:26-1087(-)